MAAINRKPISFSFVLFEIHQVKNWLFPLPLCKSLGFAQFQRKVAEKFKTAMSSQCCQLRHFSVKSDVFGLQSDAWCFWWKSDAICFQELIWCFWLKLEMNCANIGKLALEMGWSQKTKMDCQSNFPFVQDISVGNFPKKSGIAVWCFFFKILVFLKTPRWHHCVLFCAQKLILLQVHFYFLRGSLVLNLLTGLKSKTEYYMFLEIFSFTFWIRYPPSKLYFTYY